MSVEPRLLSGFFIRLLFSINYCLAPATVQLHTVNYDVTKNNLISSICNFLKLSSFGNQLSVVPKRMFCVDAVNELTKLYISAKFSQV